MKNTYSLAYTLTYIPETNRIYNWLNGEYVDFNDFEWLEKNLFIVKNQNIIYSSIKNKVEINNSNTSLQLTLLPAEMACNFACTYCYEDRTQKARMGSSHQEILMKFIKKHNMLQNIHIDWFGGEPLINSDFILNFSSELQQYTKNLGINFQSSITTNGYYLTYELCKKLLAVNVRVFQITLDGLADDHDKLRPLSNGQPTFLTILNNLLEMSNIDDDFKILIRVNFNENSNIDDFINFMKKQSIINDSRFSFIFRAIQNNWNNSSNEVSCKTQPTDLQIEYEKKALAHGFTKGDYMLLKDIGSTSCYASRENSLIVYPDMTIRKCTVALDEDINKVGYINKEGLLIKNNNWNLWSLNKYSIHHKQECMAYSFNAQCLSSACPLEFIKTGNIVCPDSKYHLEDLADNIINYIESQS